MSEIDFIQVYIALRNISEWSKFTKSIIALICMVFLIHLINFNVLNLYVIIMFNYKSLTTWEKKYVLKI